LACGRSGCAGWVAIVVAGFHSWACGRLPRRSAPPRDPAGSKRNVPFCARAAARPTKPSQQPTIKSHHAHATRTASAALPVFQPSPPLLPSFTLVPSRTPCTSASSPMIRLLPHCGPKVCCVGWTGSEQAHGRGSKVAAGVHWGLRMKRAKTINSPALRQLLLPP
jgi:hypothetical protein